MTTIILWALIVFDTYTKDYFQVHMYFETELECQTAAEYIVTTKDEEAICIKSQFEVEGIEV